MIVLQSECIKWLQENFVLDYLYIIFALQLGSVVNYVLFTFRCIYLTPSCLQQTYGVIVKCVTMWKCTKCCDSNNDHLSLQIISKYTHIILCTVFHNYVAKFVWHYLNTYLNLHIVTHFTSYVSHNMYIYCRHEHEVHYFIPLKIADNKINFTIRLETSAVKISTWITHFKQFKNLNMTVLKTRLIAWIE